MKERVRINIFSAFTVRATGQMRRIVISMPIRIFPVHTMETRWIQWKIDIKSVSVTRFILYVSLRISFAPFDDVLD